MAGVANRLANLVSLGLMDVNGAQHQTRSPFALTGAKQRKRMTGAQYSPFTKSLNERTSTITVLSAGPQADAHSTESDSILVQAVGRECHFFGVSFHTLAESSNHSSQDPTFGPNPFIQS